MTDPGIPELPSAASSCAHVAPGDCPTAVLFARWRAGEQAAFADLHARCTPLLAMRIRRHRQWPMLAPHHQVDDVVQDTWARATRPANERLQIVAPGAMVAFLGKIADRVLIDLARRLHARRRGNGTVRQSDPDELQQLPAPVSGDRPTGAARTSELLQIAQDLLTEPEFQAWHLCAIQGFTTEEAGIALMRTGAAIRGLMLRARARLVARLGARQHHA